MNEGENRRGTSPQSDVEERTDDFSPSDGTDFRRHMEWRSRYTEPEAKHGISFDAAYVGSMLLLAVASLIALWLEYPKIWFHISAQKYPAIFYYGVAWASGMLGGTLFDLKWLYHSVAKGWWNLDRRWWRLFIPHISGGLSFAVIALLSAGVIRLFDSVAVKSSYPTVVGVSFLVGYFSDSAIAKLSELASTIFGVNRKQPHRLPPPPNGRQE